MNYNVSLITGIISSHLGLYVRLSHGRFIRNGIKRKVVCDLRHQKIFPFLFLVIANKWLTDDVAYKRRQESFRKKEKEKHFQTFTMAATGAELTEAPRRLKTPPDPEDRVSSVVGGFAGKGLAWGGPSLCVTPETNRRWSTSAIPRFLRQIQVGKKNCQMFLTAKAEVV